MNTNYYVAYRTKGEEALILAFDPSRNSWSAAVGNYSVCGDLESILEDEIWECVPQVVEVLRSEVYNDDLMIVRHSENEYEFISFPLLIDRIGTVEEIVRDISRYYLFDPTEVFFEIDTTEFAPDSMAAMFYAEMQTGGEQ